jgi:hypothetical protein
VRVHGHAGVLGITLARAAVEWRVESNLRAELQGFCILGRSMGFQPGLHVSIIQFENIDIAGNMIEMDIVSSTGWQQTVMRRTVNRILLRKWVFFRAGDENRTRTISLGTGQIITRNRC